MRIRSAAPTTVAALAVLAAAAPAQADPLPQNPSVVCASAANQIDVNFANGEAMVNSTVWHDCVSVTLPAIVRGVVEPSEAHASGAPTNAAITAPSWKIGWYNAASQKIAESAGTLNFTYVGPLANAMVAVIADSGLNQIGAGTASRVCPTADQCTFDNMQIFVRV
ncbi:hypothetical protein EV562_103331 [Streptomyces sp. BK208]|uniref:hypothetical protein n=1 Tax=Streptomyces sp. BK208 TaxID=2512150 RepID=UPI00105B4FC2|nr:hypothetical protein [Streptomyces sp. BK208]TDT39960.1 hypothetical protein EV562_103331 [Streptomyces sp. BK208]